MNFELKTTEFGKKINFLDSDQVRYVRGGVTIDASTVTADASGVKRVPAGSFIGKLENGKYAVYDGEAEPNVTPTLLTADEVVLTYWGPSGAIHADQVVTAIDMARVITARLPKAPDDAVKAGMPFIAFV